MNAEGPHLNTLKKTRYLDIIERSSTCKYCLMARRI